ncbi:MAG: DHH family phosphoesterase [Lachnospiraceae bacterium]|nr:DHH family phosphoesterase [Lachnospiraceae bacterium]
MDKRKTGQNLKSYMRWPLYLSVLLLVMNIMIYAVDKEAGIVMTAFLILYIAIALLLFFMKNAVVRAGMVSYANDYSQVQRHLIREMAVPYAILDTQGFIMWANDEFSNLMGEVSYFAKQIQEILPEISAEDLPEDLNDKELHISCNGNAYKVLLRRIEVDNFGVETIEAAEGLDANSLITMYMQDETTLNQYKQELDDRKMLVGLLYIDNYEEALADVDEVKVSLLTALIDRKVTKYMQSMDSIVKKLEKDKYLFLLKNKYLPQLENSKFSLLEEVRGINIGIEMAATISMGLGFSEEGYQKSYEYARVAIDLALGRGGDQAVVKKGDQISYYGGKSVQVEKKTRVKARVKAHALRELMETRDRVMIMGHSIGDVDCFGAGVGIYRIAKTLGKKANIVINDITSTVRPVINRFLTDADYEDDMFLNSQQALELVDDNTLLVIVDVNRPSYTECPELLENAKTVVVLDHHRQVGDAIDNAVLSYIEPYASSTCEMITEILQYIDDNLKLRQVEADAMYSGIVVDSSNFVTKTGVRTFEAAAFLRRCGADITRVRKIFRSNKQEYKLRAEAVHNMEIYLDHYAITECKAEGVESPTVLGAQVANELLNITEVKASFVLTYYNEKVYVSARSIDELNVQLVMEKLGGGGHLSVAGAQLKDVTVEVGKQMVKDALNSMLEENKI